MQNAVAGNASGQSIRRFIGTEAVRQGGIGRKGANGQKTNFFRLILGFFHKIPPFHTILTIFNRKVWRRVVMDSCSFCRSLSVLDKKAFSGRRNVIDCQGSL
jgi:hypothetical protein